MDNEIARAEALYQKDRQREGYKGIYQLFVKRILDILISLLIIPFVLLVTIVVAVAIKLEDRGPVFYRSKRLGVGFSEFGMWKFRSMKVNAPDLRNADGSTFNSATDSRVTRVGRFLRETSIDEVPQVFNVLAGQMSIVGPRAGDVESKDTYEEDEKDKLMIRPGITGYTQAYYRNGISVREKRLYDAWYAHKVSFLLDLKIVMRTVITVLSHKNIYTNS